MEISIKNRDLGIFLIKWDDLEGGTVYLKYPENLEIPDNVVQQIQISHDFVESIITIKEKDWNSLSLYNEKKQMIIVLILDKYADSHDYMELLEQFNKVLEGDVSDEELLEHMKNILNMEVFRTKEEVIAKLSNELADLKMREYDIERKFDKILNLDILNVKSKILVLLGINDELSFSEITNYIKTSNNWLKKVLSDLIKNKIIGYNKQKDTYYLLF
ncbi:MAG: hypothetical protein ACTSVV_05525 [Promethearchaeota archaeon]